MTGSDTTIKVPRTLRDRIAERARRDNVTLAMAIERALDEADEQAFWTAVREEHAALSDIDRAEYLSAATLRDHLVNADDDAVTKEQAW